MMTKNWRTIIKVVGVFQIVWGIFYLTITLWGIKLLLDNVFMYNDYGWEDISITKVIMNYHSRILIPILTIFAGVTLLLNKIIGWSTGVITAGLFIVTTILLHIKLNNGQIENASVLWVILLAFITIFGILISKPVRTKFNPTKKVWIITVVIFILLLTDNFLTN